MAAESIGLPVSLDSTAIDMFRLQLARYLQLNDATRATRVRQHNACWPKTPIFSGYTRFPASAPSWRLRSWPKPAICGASVITVSF